MAHELAKQRAGPRAPDRLVVLLHGYGANGRDLVGLADMLGAHLPDTAFIAPDAPTQVPSMAGQGYRWFPIPWIDGASEHESARAMQQATTLVNAFLDKTLADEGVAPENTVLFGFSQGAMMALHVAPRRARAVAGVVAFSGQLVNPSALADETQVRPPVLLVHGDRDDVVPPQSLPAAAQALRHARWQEVKTHIQSGAGHELTPEGLAVAVNFMQRVMHVPVP